MESVEIQFDLTSTDYSAELAFGIALDEKTIVDIVHVDKPTPISLKIQTDNGEHELKFTMKNKASKHTIIDEYGKIIKDAFLKISNFTINDIELDDIFLERCKYHHDYNGSHDPVVVKFYGEIGCNGTIVFLFKSPVYNWILDTIHST